MAKASKKKAGGKGGSRKAGGAKPGPAARRGVSVATVGGVTISGPAAKSFVSRIESLFADLDTLRSEYMNSCKPIHDDIKTVYQEVKAAGIDTRAMKATIETRALERKIRRKRDDLRTTEEQNAFDAIRQAMGDFGNTPLGEAVARSQAREQTQHETNEEDDDATGAGEPARPDEAHLSGVGRGAGSGIGSFAGPGEKMLQDLVQKHSGMPPQAQTPTS